MFWTPVASHGLGVTPSVEGSLKEWPPEGCDLRPRRFETAKSQSRPSGGDVWEPCWLAFGTRPQHALRDADGALWRGTPPREGRPWGVALRLSS